MDLLSGEDDDNNAMQTPRASCKRQKQRYHADASSASASTTTTTSDSATGEKRSRSGRSSPTKNISRLQRTHTITEESLAGGKPKPPDLDALVKQIMKDARGRGILTPADKSSAALLASSKHLEDEPVLFQGLLDDDYLVDTTGTRQQLGTLPPMETLVAIYKEARDCERLGQSEAAWNCGVHYPLLHAALSGSACNKRSCAASQNIRVGIKNVTTARIAKEYGPSTWNYQHQKRVDFCLHIEPRDDRTKDKLTEIAQQVPHQGINHTDYTALLDYPITVSIETKTTGESWQEAKHQMSTWLAAHWNRIDSLLDPASARRKPPYPTEPTFLPAIIVQGHDWMFLAATRGQLLTDCGRETVLWTKVPFGSTYGIQGICQIVMVLQRLSMWSADTFWPWFSYAVLGMAESRAGEEQIQ